MVHSMIRVQLQYLIQPMGQETPDQITQEQIEFSLPLVNYSVGVGESEPDGAIQPRNVLALAQRKQGTKVVGYTLHRLKRLKTFDYEIDRDGLEEVGAHFKLTWLDPTGEEEPFILVYPLKPFSSFTEDHIDNPVGSTNIEYLLKESGSAEGENSYFLRRIEPDGAGDDIVDFCDESRKKLEDLEEHHPDEKGEIRRIKRARKKADC